MLVCASLTRSALPNLLRRDPKNRENLDRYLNHYSHHFGGGLYFCVDLETSGKHLDTLKNVQKSVLAFPNALSCLRDISRYNALMRRYLKGYILKGGRRLQQRSHMQVKISEK